MKHQLHHHRQSGFALVGAIFLLVIVAALGAFAVNTTMSQRYTSDLQLLAARAQLAAEAGVQVAARRLQATRNCATLSQPFNVAGGFSVSYGASCSRTSVAVGAATVDIFAVTVTATTTQAAYGSPDFASRTLTVRIVI